MKRKVVSGIMLTLLLTSMLVMAFSSISLVFGTSEESGFWTSDDDLHMTSVVTALTYPPLPPGTYDIVYDTEPEANWGPVLVFAEDGQQHLRVRFTPQAKGQLIREARIAWAGDWGGDNTFEIRLVDADTGLTKTTPVVTELDPWDWRVYNVSDLAFYTDGDFYVEFWAIGAIIGIYTDDTLPIYGRSEVNTETEWHYPTVWVPSDFKIRVVVETAVSGALPAAVDINPDKMNLKSHGKWVTCHIELPEDYDGSDIDVSTVMLNGEIQAELHPTEIGDYDSDGISDLMVKFSRTELTAHIYHVSGITYGNVTLMITGQLTDGTMFEGSDTIKVMFGGDVDLSGYVETADFFRWRENFGKTPDQCPPSVYPDFDDNGLVETDDFFIWRENFGATVPPPP